VRDTPEGPQSLQTTALRGYHAEDLAAEYLVAAGYRIVARNHRCSGGELDLVAWDADVLCFIEVRARSSDDFGHPLETIDQRKIARICRAASHFLESLPQPWPAMRFDALGILLTTPPDITLVQAAFEVRLH
jgi:putative endonuclease